MATPTENTLNQSESRNEFGLPFFAQREKLQMKSLAKQPEIPGVEMWNYFEGDYAQAMDTTPLQKNEVVLQGYEVIVAQQIEALLTQLEPPIVILDMGGMFGMSWLRLAKYFQDEVQKGRLQFFVANLTLDPSTIDDPQELSNPYDNNSPIFHFSEQDRELFRQCKKLVTYVNTDTAGIVRTIGIKPHLIFDRKGASAHSWVPELTRREILDSVADNGMAFWDTDLDSLRIPPDTQQATALMAEREYANTQYLDRLSSSARYAVEPINGNQDKMMIVKKRNNV